jgi:hypothetical protein
MVRLVDRGFARVAGQDPQQYIAFFDGQPLKGVSLGGESVVS